MCRFSGSGFFADFRIFSAFPEIEPPDFLPDFLSCSRFFLGFFPGFSGFFPDFSTDFFSLDFSWIFFKTEKSSSVVSDLRIDRDVTKFRTEIE